MSQLRAYVLCRFAANSEIYTSWMANSPLPVSIVDDYLPEWPLPADAGIVITHLHYRWEELTLLRKLVEQTWVPVLILSDGVLEYRNTWEHPGLAEGTLFQPLFGHKLACISRGQARVVESWGNPGKCEVVGLPRLDAVAAERVDMIANRGAAQTQPSPMETPRQAPFRILVATATTPAFDDNQRAAVVRSLQAVKDWCERHPVVSGRHLEVVWRLSAGMESELGLESETAEATDDEPTDEDDGDLRVPFARAVEAVDAVITTPSTMYLESCLHGRPTALLDFHNSPHYVNAAWSISAPEHLDRVVNELANPPAAKLLFQATVLDEQLQWRQPARTRMLQLIDAMVQAGVVARASKRPLALPARILDDEQAGFSRVPLEFDLASLFDNPAFTDQTNRENGAGHDSPAALSSPTTLESLQLARLRVELSAAVKRLEQMPLELSEKNRFITRLVRMLERSRVRVEEMHNRVVAIRKRFGVEPASESDDN